MEKAAYINSVSAYLPNSPIANEDMEDYIGKIGGNPSRVRSIVLRQNGIKTRYYGLNKNQSLTHSNAELAKEAVCGLFENENIPDDLTLLACGTSTPDQLLPSHASMVHGELANYPMEKAAYINSVSAYLPNSPIANEDMEDYIGKIGGNPSRVRSIVLRQNGVLIQI